MNIKSLLSAFVVILLVASFVSTVFVSPAGSSTIESRMDDTHDKEPAKSSTSRELLQEGNELSGFTLHLEGNPLQGVNVTVQAYDEYREKLNEFSFSNTSDENRSFRRFKHNR